MILTVYTAVVGDYDTLKEPEVVPDGVRFVCFTDQDFKSDVWEIRKVVPGSDVVNRNLRTPRRLSRYYKLLPHLFFDGPTLYVDGSIQLTGDFTNTGMCGTNLGFSLFEHPGNYSIYREATLAGPRGDEGDIERCLNQGEAFRLFGMPEDAPIYTGGVLYRPDTPRQRMFNMAWHRLYEHGSSRDQLPLNFLVWALVYPVIKFSGTIHKSNWHQWIPKHKAEA